jgi:proline dehydrogenase
MQQDRWVAPDWNAASKLCKSRNKQGIRCIFDILGEYAKDSANASEARDGYLRLVDSISNEGLDASVTVKLTALGALSDRPGCLERTLEISRYSAAKKIGFEIDMEGRDLVEYALDVAEACHRTSQNVTLTLQAYLNRTPLDLERVLQNNIRLRLVKGAYLGDTQDFVEIQACLKALIEKASAAKAQLQVGTHDPELLGWATGKAADNRGKVDFGFLMGLADKTKVAMADASWGVSEYIPYGSDWAAYVARRLKYLKDLERLGRAPVP